MRAVTYSMGMSLDGYIYGPDGTFDWSVPEPALFRSSIDEIRGVGVHLLGRKLYETMRYWDDPANTAQFDDAEREWADLWNPLPKVVFSRTLTQVDPSARLATGTLAEEIAALRDARGDGDIAIGGGELARQAAREGLIDEYWIRTFPVLVGGGSTFFAHDERHVDLELVSTRAFESGVVFSRYRVR